MGLAAMSHNFTVKVVATPVAAAMVFGGIMLASTKDASADPNRDRLRPGCKRGPYNQWVQYCQALSSAMNRNIPVQIKAATDGGDAPLYMLDGLWGSSKDTSGWIWSGHIAQTFANDSITLVTPAASDGSLYTGWDNPALTTEGLRIQKWGASLTRELPVYLQREFGVSPDRNAIAGLSMGAAATVVLAARHRGQSEQATSLSGYYQMPDPAAIIGTIIAVAGVSVVNPTGIRGLPVPVSPERRAHDPSMLLGQLQGLPMYISPAQGVQSLQSDPEVLNRLVPQLPDTVWRAVAESVPHASTQRLEQDARAAGLNAQFVYGPNGVHSRELWSRDTALARPHILGTLGLQAGSYFRACWRSGALTWLCCWMIS